MDSYKHHSSREPNNSGQKTSYGARALSAAVNELVQHGVIPVSKHTDYLGQASLYLKQAYRAVTILRESTQALGDSERPNQVPWDWFLLHQDEDIRAGLIGINPYRPVPIHDHPGASGIMLVLEGHVVERSYQVDPETEGSGDKVKLIPGQSRYLEKDGWSVFMSDWNNLHSLSAMSRPAMALSIHFHPNREKARSWFHVTDSNPDPEKGIMAVRSHLALLAHRTS